MRTTMKDPFSLMTDQDVEVSDSEASNEENSILGAPSDMSASETSVFDESADDDERDDPTLVMPRNLLPSTMEREPRIKWKPDRYGQWSV